MRLAILAILAASAPAHAGPELGLGVAWSHFDLDGAAIAPRPDEPALCLSLGIAGELTPTTGLVLHARQSLDLASRATSELAVLPRFAIADRTTLAVGPALLAVSGFHPSEPRAAGPALELQLGRTLAPSYAAVLSFTVLSPLFYDPLDERAPRWYVQLGAALVMGGP